MLSDFVVRHMVAQHEEEDTPGQRDIEDVIIHACALYAKELREYNKYRLILNDDLEMAMYKLYSECLSWLRRLTEVIPAEDMPAHERIQNTKTKLDAAWKYFIDGALSLPDAPTEA